MDQQFIKRIDLNDDLFEQFKTDFNFVIQRLLGNMVEKKSNEGKVSISLDIFMINEYIPDNTPGSDAETRLVLKPQFKHKITSKVIISDEKGGNLNNEMEMVLNEDGCFVLQPVANTTQASIFDADFEEVMRGDSNTTERPPSLMALLGDRTAGALPDKENQSDDTVDAEYTDVTDNDEELPDATDVLFSGMNPPTNDDDEDWSYDEPED